MPIPIKKRSAADSLATISNVLLTAFVFATLYFGRELLVPLALAALLTFMLAPLVTRLQRLIGRVASVLVIVALILVGTAGAGWILTRQAVDLVNKLPDYKENISTKLRSIQLPIGGPTSRITQTLEELKNDLPGAAPEENQMLRPDARKNKTAHAVKVEVVNETGGLEFVQGVLTPVLGPIGTAGLVVLLLIFMLLEREDLRNRLIRLVGQGRIGTTSRALDDAGTRVAKYLLMQLIVNVTYGLAVMIGLYFIGVPNAALWGTLAIVLRFVPYVGPWIAAAFPILLSSAVSPGWSVPLLTIGMFVVLELLSNNVMEPLLYSSSTGVTPIALIVAALVWTWLWGAVGLMLATPLTVCLVVMGRHIPRFAFLSIMLSDEESLTPAQEFYHRLYRTGDHDESEFVEDYLKNNPPALLFDAVLLPVIATAEKDHRAGMLEDGQLESMENSIGEILEELEARLDAGVVRHEHQKFQVACIPAKAYRDELAGAMLVSLLRHNGYLTRNSSAKMVSGERIDWVRNGRPDVVCISAVPPSNTIHARYLCLKLRAEFPDLTLVVGMWGADQNPEEVAQLHAAGADEVVHEVTKAAEFIAQLAPRWGGTCEPLPLTP